jgi:hypothetical protein
MQRYIATSVQWRDSNISTILAWSTMQAGVLLSVFFELLLEVVDEDGETACSASGRATVEMG